MFNVSYAHFSYIYRFSWWLTTLGQLKINSLQLCSQGTAKGPKAADFQATLPGEKWLDITPEIDHFTSRFCVDSVCVCVNILCAISTYIYICIHIYLYIYIYIHIQCVYMVQVCMCVCAVYLPTLPSTCYGRVAPGTTLGVEPCLSCWWLHLQRWTWLGQRRRQSFPKLSL